MRWLLFARRMSVLDFTAGLVHLVFGPLPVRRSILEGARTI